MPAFVIRDRVPADLDDVVAVMAGVHRGDGYPAHWPADPAAWLTTSRLIAAWVATLDGHIVGHAALFHPGRGDAAPGLAAPGLAAPGLAAPGLAGPGAPAAMVSRLFVASAARGHRGGAALLDHAAAAARARGYRALLDVHDTNTAAIALYERLGWRLLGSGEAVWGGDRVTILSYAAPD